MASPNLPPRPGTTSQAPPAYNDSFTTAPPPKRDTDLEHDASSPIYFSRDPKRLTAYLVPFPKPLLHKVPAERVPLRFMIYTPPPPPLQTPKEGEKETRVHKVQRKWENEIREAKTSTAKTMSWHGIKSKAIKGINWGMSQTKTSNLEFLNRIGVQPDESAKDKHEDDGHSETADTKKTVSLEEMLLVYPSSMTGTPNQLREEFVNTMLRSKSKAQRDAIIATGLLPVSAAIDICATLIWPFGGLLEIDAVWLFASFRGAKTSRSVTKRLTSTSHDGKHDDDQLRLEFTPSPEMAVLERYLAAECHKRDPKLFTSSGVMPTESEVLEAIGWTPAEKGGLEKNWEDEQWEIAEVKDDLKSVMHKGAREWDKWCKAFEKNPEKAEKK